MKGLGFRDFGLRVEANLSVEMKEFRGVVAQQVEFVRKRRSKLGLHRTMY